MYRSRSVVYLHVSGGSRKERTVNILCVLDAFREVVLGGRPLVDRICAIWIECIIALGVVQHLLGVATI